MNAITRFEINEHLQESFQALNQKADATPEEWDALGMEYYGVGYFLNAGVCFKRADAIVVAVVEMSAVEVRDAVVCLACFNQVPRAQGSALQGDCAGKNE